MKYKSLGWGNAITLKSKGYVCGYCGSQIASDKGYPSTGTVVLESGVVRGCDAYIYLCHKCHKPTFIEPDESQTPGEVYGEIVKGIPDASVENLYNEARNCFTVNAYTASVLCSRKLLMNIAVSKGDKEGKNFTEYVNYLSDKGYVPPDGKEWVDHIRKRGNEATHEIKIMGKEDAEELISFAEMLLKFIYEFPATIKGKISGSSKP